MVLSKGGRGTASSRLVCSENRRNRSRRLAHSHVLYCFFVIGHDRRKILRFSVTRNPNALWTVQQMREAWPYTPAGRTKLRSVGWEVADETCWITSSS